MRKYQSPDERELDGKQVKNLFNDAGFECRTEFYDYISTPLAGLFPAWRSVYAAARWADEILIRIPVLREMLPDSSPERKRGAEFDACR